jgi:PAS domain S-box-containing protein
MKIFESTPGMYVYRHLPGFAKFLLANLDAYVSDQIILSREFNLPLLKYLKHHSEDQFRAIATQSSVEYLGYLAENKARLQLENSQQRWLLNELKVIGKFEISSEDVTVINYVRLKAFKKWIRVYNISPEEKFELADEIDNLFFGSVTSGTDTLIEILKETLAHESHFNARLISTSPGLIFIYDIEKQKDIYVNGNVKDIMGYTSEEVINLGENLLPFFTHPDDMPHLVDAIQTIIADREGKTHQLEYRFKHKDGLYRWLRSYYTIFKRNVDGAPTELLGVTFEVTREKEIALELANREYQLREAQSIAQIGSFFWDFVNNVSTNSPELIKILEIEEQGGREFFMSKVHPDDKDRVERLMAESFVTGVYDCQYRYAGKHGEKVLWGRGKVEFRNNKPFAMRGTVQDITTLKKIEHELLKKTRELERSNESLQQFASVASHDLREPLRKMSMYSDMVLMQEEESLSQTSRSNLAKVKSSAIRMQQMIEDILSFSSITNEIKRTPTSLKDVVKEVMLVLEEFIHDKKAVISYDDLPEMLLNPSQMRQMFQNLISNAIKFSRPGIPAKIDITHQFASPNFTQHPDLLNAERYLVIRVTDNGIGFKQEYAEKIFGLFTRLHPQSTYEGSGLGLSICKRVVENHGGIIFAESEPGQGTTFNIVLPDLVTRNGSSKN